MRHRTIRSRETEGSPASILAIRDWLDFSNLAASAWVRWRRTRRRRREYASRSLTSINAASSGERRRNSGALPIRHPLFSNRLRFDSRMVVLPRLLAIRVRSIDDPPGRPRVHDSQLLTPRSNGRHGARMRHAKMLPPLQTPEEVPCLQPRWLRKGWRLHFSVQPNKGLVLRVHPPPRAYVRSDMLSRGFFDQPDQGSPGVRQPARYGCGIPWKSNRLSAWSSTAIARYPAGTRVIPADKQEFGNIRWNETMEAAMRSLP